MKWIQILIGKLLASAFIREEIQKVRDELKNTMKDIAGDIVKKAIDEYNAKIFPTNSVKK